MNIVTMSLFSASFTVIVYVTISRLLGITQGTENVPSLVIGVCNVAITTSFTSAISMPIRVSSDFAIPLIVIVWPELNSVSASCNAMPFSVGTLMLMSILFVSRRLCAVSFHVPSSALTGIPISFVAKLPEPSENV